MNVTAPKVSSTELAGGQVNESSAQIRERVMAARQAQRERLEPYGLKTNAEMNGKILRTAAFGCEAHRRAERRRGPRNADGSRLRPGAAYRLDSRRFGGCRLPEPGAPGCGAFSAAAGAIEIMCQLK